MLLDAGVLPDQQRLGQILLVVPDGYIALKLRGEAWSRSGGEAEPAILCELPAHEVYFLVSVGLLGLFVTWNATALSAVSRRFTLCVSQTRRRLPLRLSQEILEQKWMLCR